MPLPREVFEHPDVYWSFLTAEADTDFEDQYFDRKEAGRIGSSGSVDKNSIQGVIKQITEIVSAFANSNVSGSLLGTPSGYCSFRTAIYSAVWDR